MDAANAFLLPTAGLMETATGNCHHTRVKCEAKADRRINNAIFANRQGEFQHCFYWLCQVGTALTSKNECIQSHRQKIDLTIFPVAIVDTRVTGHYLDKEAEPHSIEVQHTDTGPSV